MEKKKESNTWRNIVICIVIVALIGMGMGIQMEMSKQEIKISTVDVWGNEFEEGDEINLDFIYEINVPTDELTAQLYLSSPHYNRECFEYQFYKNMTIIDIENRHRDYWDIYVKEDLPTKCFGDYELEIMVYGMGLRRK